MSEYKKSAVRFERLRKRLLVFSLFIATCSLLIVLVSCFDGNYIIRHITDPLFDKAFTVTVINGSGGGEYKEGDIVSIKADTITGREFKNWTVNSGGVTLANADSTTTTFTMPKNDVRVTANFEATTDPTYLVTINPATGGTATGGGYYADGETVSITATPETSYIFTSWTVNSGGVTVANTSPATFTMPPNAVTVTPTFTATRPLPTTYITLTEDIWEDADLPAMSVDQWFSFTASAATTHYIHFKPGTANDIVVRVYAVDGSVGIQLTLSRSNLYGSGSTLVAEITAPLVAGNQYYIRVWGFNAAQTGLYQLAFNTSTTPP